MNIYSLNAEWGLLCWVVTGLLFFFILEKWVVYRSPTLPLFRRWRINVSLNLSNVAIIDLFFVYLVKQVSFFADPPVLDIFAKFHVNSFWRVAITVLVMDLAIYFWHRMNHEVPFLWRFHRVHHTDRNLDVSSAFRFHFGEVTGSTIIMYGIMLILGSSILEVRIFQLIFFLAAQFEHSNIRLWKPLERAVWFLFVPPAMHRIHHSNIQEETDSNYGTFLSIWDRIFGTFRKNVAQEKIVYGLKEFSDEQELSLGKLLILPFRK